MNAQASARTLMDANPDADSQTRAAIIRRCDLNDEAVAEIFRLQGLLSASFSDAAIRLGYATQADIDMVTGSTSVSVIGHKKAMPAPCLVVAHQPDHPRSEQIRLLRTELLLRHEAVDTANIFAILSPCPREGRSQLAAELAIAFAQLGQPTLLVDADLRHPRQHVLFNANNAYGLSQALVRGQKPRFQTVAELPSLFLLTSGPPLPNPLDLLSDRLFEGLADEWQRDFQFVVLDTPPVRQYADGLAVATIIGRVLSLSHARHTPYKHSLDMMRRLAATRSRVLGAVINHF